MLRNRFNVKLQTFTTRKRDVHQPIPHYRLWSLSGFLFQVFHSYQSVKIGKLRRINCLHFMLNLVPPEGLEPPISTFVAWCIIHCAMRAYYFLFFDILFLLVLLLYLISFSLYSFVQQQ